MSHSPDILSANKRLLQLRQKLLVQKKVPAPIGSSNKRGPLSDLRENLPAHLGWGSQRFTAVLPNRQQSTINKTQSTSFAPHPSLLTLRSSPSIIHNRQPKIQIKHYPAIGIGALKQKLVPQYQLWLACRTLDETGQGWVNLAEMRASFTGRQATLPLFGWRRMRQLLQRGEGLFWQKDLSKKRLWLFSASRIARVLKVEKLTGSPVLFETAVFTQGIGTFKAHLYAAWHSGRQNSQPISRQTLRQLTKVPERTQRDYEKETKVVAKPNLAIGETYTAVSLQNHAWEKGGALFKFTDWNGRLGSKMTAYHAWQLPNSYAGPHTTAPNGRQKRINYQLTDLVQKGAQGNSESNFERLYYENGKEAVKALNRAKSGKVYWETSKGNSYQLWHPFFYSQR